MANAAIGPPAPRNSSLRDLYSDLLVAQQKWNAMQIVLRLENGEAVVLLVSRESFTRLVNVLLQGCNPQLLERSTKGGPRALV
jgi:hypothetical protein